MVAIDKIMAYENGDLDMDEIVELFQSMVDDGTVWQLQGSYGRMAKALILDGYVTDTHNVLTRGRD